MNKTNENFTKQFSQGLTAYSGFKFVEELAGPTKQDEIGAASKLQGIANTSDMFSNFYNSVAQRDQKPKETDSASNDFDIKFPGK